MDWILLYQVTNSAASWIDLLKKPGYFDDHVLLYSLWRFQVIIHMLKNLE